jgi:hypothetical protein
MKETIANYVNGSSQWTVVKDNMFFVECRVNGYLTKSIPFLTESEAKEYAGSHGHTSQQLLNESV